MTLTDLVDDAIEISVVGSFSRIGYAVRRRLFRWAPADPGSLSGRTVLVTGPTSGLGRPARRPASARDRLGMGRLRAWRSSHSEM